MAKLSYDATWTQENEDAISVALNLNAAEKKSLFTNHKAIAVTKDQIAKLAALNESDDDADDDDATDQPDDAKPEDHTDADADKPDVIDISIAGQRSRDAVNLGEKFSANTNSAIEAGYEAREKVNITPLLIWQGLKSDLGDKLASLPMPNSYLKDGKTWHGTNKEKIELGNEPYDKFTYNDINDNNKQVTKKGSYYSAMFLASTLGKKLASDLKLVDEAIASTKENGPVCPTIYKGMGRVKLGKRKTLFTSRINFGIAQLKKAANIDRQCTAFDSLSLVGYSFDTETVDGQEVFINRNEPVTLFAMVTGKVGGKEQLVPSAHVNYSIGSFLKFNVKEAVDKVAAALSVEQKEKNVAPASLVTLENVQDTVKREKPTPVVVSDAKAILQLNISTPADVSNVFSAFNLHFMNEDDSISSKHVAAYITFLTKAENNEELLKAGDGITAMEEIWKHIEKPYLAANSNRAAVRLQEKNLREREAINNKSKAA